MTHINNIKITIFLVLLFSQLGASAQTAPDPGIPGPYPVTKAEYNLGDLAATLDSFGNQVEVRGSVHYPTGLAAGPYPVIVLLHGRHATCYRTSSPFNATLAWPCPSGYASIESFQGYDYHAKFMASHGYIVISISCNAINAADNSRPDRGMPARGQLVQYHLNLWNAYNTTGGAPFGTTFVGKLDLQRIGTMGHSRGGEGVVYHARLNESLGSPYGIKGVITLAPVDFFRRTLNNIPLMNIAPYCDGDVSNIQGVHFYDDVRYNVVTDEAPKHNIVMMGANHNFYNTVWTPGSYISGTSDDWGATSTDPHCGASVPGNGRFDTSTQKSAYNSYASAFFRMYVGGEEQFAPILEVKDVVPPASSMLDTSNVFVSWQPGPFDRVDINRIQTVSNETINTLGGTVASGGLVSSGICGGGLGMTACSVSSSNSKEPHKGTSSVGGLAQMGLRWNSAADYYENNIPAAEQDLTLAERLQFRAALRFNQCTPGVNLNFTVQLIDSAGDIASTDVHQHSYALFYQPGTHATLLPKVMFNTISIPIDSFTGIDRTKVRKVKFLFDKSVSGSILVSDIAFVNSKCGILDATYGYDYDTIGYDMDFMDTVTANNGDTVSILWNFGDPASGLADTSTAHNPNHVFTTAGDYNVCLYVYAKRGNVRTCKDSLCTTVHLDWALAASDPLLSHIKVYPNPAQNFIRITGADDANELQLLNSIGQTVLSTQLNSGYVAIPENLPNGLYYVVITTPDGQAHRKIIVTR